MWRETRRIMHCSHLIIIRDAHVENILSPRGIIQKETKFRKTSRRWGDVTILEDVIIYTLVPGHKNAKWRLYIHGSITDRNKKRRKKHKNLMLRFKLLFDEKFVHALKYRGDTTRLNDFMRPKFSNSNFRITNDKIRYIYYVRQPGDVCLLLHKLHAVWKGIVKIYALFKNWLTFDSVEKH